MRRATVFGRCESSTGIEPFTARVDQVMTREPHASARCVFWIVDNGSSHRGRSVGAAVSECGDGPYPVHASWLDQVEIYFSMVQRKVLTPNDFPDLGAAEDRLSRFAECYNATATPFRWLYTRTDLHGICSGSTTRTDSSMPHDPPMNFRQQPHGRHRRPDVAHEVHPAPLPRRTRKLLCHGGFELRYVVRVAVRS